jgi:hypothetical protein
MLDIMLRDLLTPPPPPKKKRLLIVSENIKLKIGHRPLLYQLFSKRDLTL